MPARRIPGDEELLENFVVRVVDARLDELIEDLETMDISNIKDEPYFLVEGRKILLTYNLANRLNGLATIARSSIGTISAGGSLVPTTGRIVFAAYGENSGWQLQLGDGTNWRNALTPAGDNIDAGAGVLVVFAPFMSVNQSFIRFYNGGGVDTTNFRYWFTWEDKDITHITV